MSAFPRDSPQTHGGQLRKVAAQYELLAERLTDFSANINPEGPPASVLTAIRRALEDPTTLMAYPDLELAELKKAISVSGGVRKENVAVANGFVPLLEAALRLLKIKRCLLPVPSFSEYRSTLENANIAVTPIQLLPGEKFRYEPDAIVKALLDHSCEAVLLANPQNPSGALCDATTMRELVKLASQNGVSVLLDEAFIDYCPFDSLIQLAIVQANVIVFRSVTKFFSIPGLRVAYAVGHPSNVEAMNRFIAPWPLTSFATDAVCAALLDKKFAETSRDGNERRRLLLEQHLAQLGIATYPSSANFLLLRFPETIDVNLLWERMIVEEQIVLRLCANFEGLADGHLRIAVRSEKENMRLVEGLKRVLS
jgi:threonine-phosphate decarboxylase